jgi:hypothetical protein
MRKSDLLKNHEPFDAALARYRGFMERVIAAEQLISTTQEKRDIAESVLLRLCAQWEKFVDEHLVDCANRDASMLSKHFEVTIPRNPSWDLCHALIIGAGYTDFRSFGDLKGYAKKLLPDGSNPFLHVSAPHAKKIDEVFRIRNYLSHYSASARKSLMHMYQTQYEMERFLEPGQFVLAYNAKRLWAYFDAFQGASDNMQVWLHFEPIA